jgi:hypothetical protein
LLGDGLTYGGGAMVDSGECRVEAEGRRLGVGPGHGAELLRQLAVAGTSGSVGNTMAASVPSKAVRWSYGGAWLCLVLGCDVRKGEAQGVQGCV